MPRIEPSMVVKASLMKETLVAVTSLASSELSILILVVEAILVVLDNGILLGIIVRARVGITSGYTLELVSGGKGIITGVGREGRRLEGMGMVAGGRQLPLVGGGYDGGQGKVGRRMSLDQRKRKKIAFHL